MFPDFPLCWSTNMWGGGFGSFHLQLLPFPLSILCQHSRASVKDDTKVETDSSLWRILGCTCVLQTLGNLSAWIGLLTAEVRHWWMPLLHLLLFVQCHLHHALLHLKHHIVGWTVRATSDMHLTYHRPQSSTLHTRRGYGGLLHRLSTHHLSSLPY